MEKKIYKYYLKLHKAQIIILPKGAEILTVQVQGQSVCIWVLVNPDETKMEERIIETFATGESIYYDEETKRKYIGTYQLFDGARVYHVFEGTD